MPQQSKAKWASLKVGILAMVAMAIVTVLVFLITGHTNPFASKTSVFTYVSDSASLAEGAPVSLNGIPIGKVKSIILSGSKELGRTVRIDLQIPAESFQPGPTLASGEIGIQQFFSVALGRDSYFLILDFCVRIAYPAQPVPDGEAMLKTALLDLAGEWPTYGYRRLTAMMRRLGWPVNANRVRRWMDELGIHGAPPVRKKRTTNSNHAFPRYPNLVKDLEITRPDQVWVADITYIRLRREFVYLAILMDVLLLRLAARSRFAESGCPRACGQINPDDLALEVARLVDCETWDL